MKNKTILFLLSIVLYLVCFYDQNFGTNVLLFTPWLLLTQVILFPKILREIKWMIGAAASIITAFGIWYTNSTLAIPFHVFMLSFTAVLVLDQRSILIQLITAAFNWFWNIPGMISDYLNRKKESDSKVLHYLLLSIIPFIITIVFILLYSSANPVFDWLIEKIDLSFIKFSLIISLLIGFFLLYLFFFPKRNEVFNALEVYMPERLQSGDYQPSPFSKNEYLSGIILLSMLNVVLLLFNLTDLITYFATDTLPEGITYAGLVHQGVGTMIFSIVLAIGIILYFYRGNQNYNPNKTLLSLSLVWIVQNILMVLVIFWKNGLYIQEYGLTYKRIGVYIWLGLCIGGLITTLLKISQKKSIYYLLKSNVAIAFFTLSIVLSFNWDRTIAWYNLNHCRQKYPDLAYLLSLSSSVYPEVTEYIIKQNTPVPTELYYNLQIRAEETSNDSFLASNYERKRIAASWSSLNKYYLKKNKVLVPSYQYYTIFTKTSFGYEAR